MTLDEFFQAHPKVALGFSGGVDSSYLLYAAMQAGADVQAYFAKTQFQPEFELEDALKLGEQLGAKLTVLHYDVLPAAGFNPLNRCYYCKTALFGTLVERAKQDGYDTIIDGTNASDDAGDRPGMKALQEMQVLSPLRLCGLTKQEIREKSREAGLFTWNKPAYACLATRFPAGTEITAEGLQRVEKAEGALFRLGFTDFRVRVYHGAARIQLPESQMERGLAMRYEILEQLRPLFQGVFLDLEGR